MNEEIKQMAERNYELIKQNTEKINTNLERINQNSYVINILKDYKEDSKRLFYVLLVVLALFIGTWAYILFVK